MSHAKFTLPLLHMNIIGQIPDETTVIHKNIIYSLL